MAIEYRLHSIGRNMSNDIGEVDKYPVVAHIRVGNSDRLVVVRLTKVALANIAEDVVTTLRQILVTEAHRG